MKKSLSLILLLLGALTLILVTSCSDDKSSTGSQDDPQFQTFSNLFGYVDESTGTGIQIPFLFMDSIFNQGGPTKLTNPVGLSVNDVSLTWLSSTGYWYCTATMVEGEQTFYLTDSIQFRVGSTPVQYPAESVVTQITSYATLVMTGPGIDTARVFQNLNMTYAPLTDIVTVNGNGGTMAEMNDGECAVSFDYAQTFTNLQWYSEYMFGNDEVNCPHAGSLNYTGSISGQCVGSDNSINGQWNVSAIFDNGIIHYTVTSGGTQWTVNEECYTGMTTDLSMADTLFVENVFGDGGMDQFLEGFDLALALMAEQQLMGGTSPGFKNHLGESPLSDSVIVNSISSYAYSGGWHIFSFSAETISFDDTAAVEGTDSVRFILDGSPQQFIDNPLVMDSITNHVHFTVSASGSEGLVGATMDQLVMGTITSTEVDTTVSFLGTMGVSATIVATDGNDGTCEVSVSLDQAINNVLFDPYSASDCPLAGEVVSDFEIYLGCSSNDGLNNFAINGAWTVTATVNNNDTVTVSYVNEAGTASWTRTHDCNQTSPSALSLHYHAR